MGSFFTSLFAPIGIPAGHPTCVVINGRTHKLQKMLGEGGYAFVYLATRLPLEGTSGETKRTVAVKRFLLKDGLALDVDGDGSASEEAQKHNKVLQEVELHKSLCPHPNIVGYIDHQLVRAEGKCPEVFVAMELAAGESMQSIVNNVIQNGEELSLRHEVLPFLSDVVNAVAHLHAQSPPVSHWDLKLDNILTDNNAAVITTAAPTPPGQAAAVSGPTRRRHFLCDFGSASQQYYHPTTSKDINTAEMELDEKMTLLYRSPESLDLWEKKRIDEKSDLWSIGVMLYVLMFRKMPFEATKQAVIQARIVMPPPELGPNDDTGAGLPTAPATRYSSRVAQLVNAQEEVNLGVDLRVILNKLLSRDPADRPTIFVLSEMVNAIYPSHQVQPAPGSAQPQHSRF